MAMSKAQRIKEYMERKKEQLLVNRWLPIERERVIAYRQSVHFESGHGKSPCDGVGGTTKRNADNAVKQGKVLIQDAADFYAPTKWEAYRDALVRTSPKSCGINSS
jgi:hypothetical protein